MNTDELYQQQYKPTDGMSKAELLDEVRTWRNLWTWVEEDSKYYLTKVGQMCRLTTRNYKGHLGRLLTPHFVLKELELEVVEREYNYDDGRYYIEAKTLRIPITQITHIEIISERELAEELALPPSSEAQDMSETTLSDVLE